MFSVCAAPFPPRADPLPRHRTPRRAVPRHRTPAASRRIRAHDFCKKGTSLNRKCLVFARAFPSFQDIRPQRDCNRLATGFYADVCPKRKNCGSVSTLPQRLRPALASFPPFARRCGRRLCHLAAAIPRPCPPIASEPNARSRLRGSALRRRIFFRHRRFFRFPKTAYHKVVKISA